MNKNYYLTIAFILIAIKYFSQIPQYQWAFEFGSPSICPGVDVINSVKVDNLGDIIITSSHGSNVTSTPPSFDFDPGPGSLMLTPSTYEGDLFIQKVDNNKNLLWVRQFGSGVGSTKGYSEVDANGNIYTFGAFVGTIDFDPSTSTVFNLTATGSGAAYFILNLDTNGIFVWSKQIKNAGMSVALTYFWNSSPIFIDANNNVYITADFMNTADFDPGANTYYLNVGSNNNNLFIEKLDVNGNFLWAKNFGLGVCYNQNGWDGDNICAIKTDVMGNIFVAGTFSTSADVDFGAGVHMLTVTKGNMFVEKMDAKGNF